MWMGNLELGTGRIAKVSLLNKKGNLVNYNLALVKEKSSFSSLDGYLRFGFLGDDGSFFKSSSIHLTPSSGAGVTEYYVLDEVPPEVEIITTDLKEIAKELEKIEQKKALEVEKDKRRREYFSKIIEKYEGKFYTSSTREVSLIIKDGNFSNLEILIHDLSEASYIKMKEIDFKTPSGRLSKKFKDLLEVDVIFVFNRFCEIKNKIRLEIVETHAKLKEEFKELEE